MTKCGDQHQGFTINPLEYPDQLAPITHNRNPTRLNRVYLLGSTLLQTITSTKGVLDRHRLLRRCHRQHQPNTKPRDGPQTISTIRATKTQTPPGPKPKQTSNYDPRLGTETTSNMHMYDKSLNKTSSHMCGNRRAPELCTASPSP